MDKFRPPPNLQTGNLIEKRYNQTVPALSQILQMAWLHISTSTRVYCRPFLYVFSNATDYINIGPSIGTYQTIV